MSEGVQNHPSHSVPSQKGTEVNKEVNTSLLATSQKVSNIEKRLPNQEHRTRAWTLAKHYHPNQKCLKEEINTTTVGSQGAHIVVQSLSSSVTELLPQSVIDASPTNVEKHPHSLKIPFPTPSVKYFLNCYD